MNNNTKESENILDFLSEEQKNALYEGYIKLADEHNLSERRIMRILKLKEYELKTLLTLSDIEKNK